MGLKINDVTSLVRPKPATVVGHIGSGKTASLSEMTSAKTQTNVSHNRLSLTGISKQIYVVFFYWARDPDETIPRLRF